MSKISDILQTEDEEEQVRRIELLMQAANTPPLAMTILFRPSTRSVELAFTGQITADQAHFLLEMAKKNIIRQEIELENQPPRPD
jgi:hypothetical protein